MTPLGTPTNEPSIRPFNSSMIASKPVTLFADRSTSMLETLELLLAEEFGASEDRPITFKRKPPAKKSTASYSELVMEATAASIVAANGTDLAAYLAFTAKGVNTLVNYLLGAGTISTSDENDRKPTPVEVSLTQLSARRIAAALTKLSSNDSQHEFVPAALQCDRQSLQALSTESPVVTYEIQVMTPHSTGLMTLALNAAAYSHFCGQVSDEQIDHPKDISAWNASFENKLKDATVELVACIDGGRMQLLELAQLRVGAVVPLCREEPGAVSLLQNQTLLSKCTLGQADGKFSLRVEEVLDRNDAILHRPVPAGEKSQVPLAQGTAGALVVGSRNV